MIKPPLVDPRGGFLLSFSSVLTGCDIKLGFLFVQHLIGAVVKVIDGVAFGFHGVAEGAGVGSFFYFCSDAVYQGFNVSLGGVNTQYHELVTAYAVYTMLTLCGFPETVA